VFVIEAADRTKPALTSEFFEAIKQPPAQQIHQASELRAPERAERRKINKDTTILHLERRNAGKWHSRYSDNELVWREDDRLSAFDGQQTYYYVALSGYEVISSYSPLDVKSLIEDINAANLFGSLITLYGVRKADLAEVEKRPNWQRLETAVERQLTNIPEPVMLSYVKTQAKGLSEVLKQVDRVATQLPAQHPLTVLIDSYARVTSSANLSALGRVLKQFKCEHVADAIKQSARAVEDLIDQYPLLVSLIAPKAEAVVDYVNLIDARKATK
jgi:hypothetical protein